MIGVEGLVVEAGGFTLLADLAAPAGSLCAVIGPSGAGKSTLLAAIAGFAPVRAGRIVVAGRDLAGLAPAERPVTLLFQENNLFPDLDIEANVGLGLRPSLSLNRAERARVAAALEEIGLEGLGARLPAELSGGQRQRAALARALLRERPVLLLDEPFAALGPGLRAQMLDLVDRTLRARGATVLMVTHQPEDARRADLVAFCAEVRPGAEGPATGGRIVGALPAASAFADPPPAMAAYLGLVVGGAAAPPTGASASRSTT